MEMDYGQGETCPVEGWDPWEGIFFTHLSFYGFPQYNDKIPL